MSTQGNVLAIVGGGGGGIGQDGEGARTEERLRSTPKKEKEKCNEGRHVLSHYFLLLVLPSFSTSPAACVLFDSAGRQALNHSAVDPFYVAVKIP